MYIKWNEFFLKNTTTIWLDPYPKRITNQWYGNLVQQKKDESLLFTKKKNENNKNDRDRMSGKTAKSNGISQKKKTIDGASC